MQFFRNHLSALLFAVQFLTRIQIPTEVSFSSERERLAAGYFPLVGALIGAAAALVYWLCVDSFGTPIAILLSLAVTIALTGAFHEDGLADTFDSFGANDKDAALAIMRDSRLGTYGTCALFLVLTLKTAALISLPQTLVVYLLISAHGLSRLSSMVVVASSQYVRDEGAAKPVAKAIDGTALIVILGTGITILIFGFVFYPASMILWLAAGTLTGHFISRLCYEKRLGGYTGDCLGATQQITELSIYLAAILWL